MIGLPSSAWAMQEEALSALLRQASDPHALQSRLPAKAAAGERLGVRDGVGILFAAGPLVKADTWFSRTFGFTSYEMLRRDLQAALDGDKIDALVIYVDSAGGEANGCDELAEAIFAARRKKPIAAYVSGMGCSAAYWIASAAERVTVSEAAIVGSIGVAVTIEDRDQADQRRGVSKVQFVSSQSPNKAFAPARVQRMVDSMGDVFVRHVARNRGVTAETVITKFGAGGVEIGRKAVAAGMADAVGDFDKVLADLRGKPMANLLRPLSAAAPATAPVLQKTVAAPIALSAEAAAKLKAAAQAEHAARERIRAIFNSAEAKASEDLASHYAFETDLPADAALAAMREKLMSARWSSVINRMHP